MDSAPRFWFAPSGRSPSRHPPVRGSVQGQAEGVATQEPLEGVPGPPGPHRIPGGRQGVQAAGNGGAGLHRLLVVVGPDAAPDVESGAADGQEPAVGVRLLPGQPVQGLQSGGGPVRAAAASSGEDEGLGQAGVGVGEAILEPPPRGPGPFPVQRVQAPGQVLSQGRRRGVPRHGGQVGVGAQERVGPRSGPGERPGRRQRRPEQFLRQGPASRIPGPGDGGPQGPQGPAVAVLGPQVLQPPAGEVHEVPEPAQGGVESVAHEGQVSGSQPGQVRRRAGPLQAGHEQQGPGIVVQAVALLVPGHREPGVLQDPGGVGHDPEEVQVDGRPGRGQGSGPPRQGLRRGVVHQTGRQAHQAGIRMQRIQIGDVGLLGGHTGFLIGLAGGPAGTVRRTIMLNF